MVLEKTLESPLDSKEIQPVHSKGDQSWMYFGRNDSKAETPVLWPPNAKSWLFGKDSDAGRDWGQEEKGTTEWDGWMASPTRWTWVWVNSGRWRWTGRPGVLRFMGSQRVGHDWVTELRQIYRDVSLEIWMIEGSSNLEEKHPSLREYRVQKPWISRTSLSVPRIQRHQQVLERNEVC